MSLIRRYCLRNLLTITVVVCYICSFGQSTDSLRKELSFAKTPYAKVTLLAELSFALTSSKPDSAILLAKQGEKIAYEIRNKGSLAECYASMGWGYFKAGKNDSAVFYLEKAKQFFQEEKNFSRQGRVMVNLASIFNLESKDEKALTYLMDARKLFDNEKDQLTIAYTDKIIAGTFRHQGEYKKAKQYLFEAIQTFEKLNNIQYKGDAYSSLGSVYWEEKNFDSALYYYRQSSNINKQTHNRSNIAFASENIGDAFIEKSQLGHLHPFIDSAYFYYNNAREIFAALDDQQDVRYEEFKIGRVLRFLKENDKAAKYLLGSLHYFDSARLYVNANETCEELGLVYKEKGDYKNAYMYLDRSAIYKDSINNRNRADLIAKMLAQYESEKTDKTNRLIEAQKKIDKEELSRTIAIEFFSLGMIILIGLLAMTLWNRKILKQQLKEVEMRNQLASDLHDDVGSTLSSILLLSDIASKNKDEALHISILNKISSNAKEVIERMSDIVWTMNPINDEGDNLKERIENYVLQVKQLAEINAVTDISDEIGEIKWPMDIRKNIFLICKEAINNSLKYAKASNLKVSFFIKDKTIFLEIKDDGIGFDVNNNNSGNGLRTMANRAKSNGGKCFIESTSEMGTTVKVVMPIPHSRYI